MIVIPMAGLSQRFTDAGYRQPKYMLDLAGRTVFAHAVSSFASLFGSERFLFIARDIQGTRAFLERQIAELQLPHSSVAILDRPTRGQADTVRLGLAQADVSPEEHLTIFNIDTFRPNFTYPDAAWMKQADGYLEVMPGTDPGFSFVLPDTNGEERVSRTAEKQVISELASTGLYWFRRSSDFLQALADKPSAGATEQYIAPLYNQLIANGCDIRYDEIKSDDVVFCGTPAQYQALLETGYGNR